MTRRWVLPVVLLAAGTALAAGAWLTRPAVPVAPEWSRAPVELQAVLWPEPRRPAGFRLTTQHEEAFTDADLEGGWSFLFFGYVQCPDVCPMTLWALREVTRALREAHPAAPAHRVLFVSVDPDQDDAATLAAYLGYFDPGFLGLTGSADELARLTQSLAVMAVEVSREDGRRSIDHTASVMVVAPDGRVVAALPPPHEPGRMLAHFEQLRRYRER